MTTQEYRIVAADESEIVGDEQHSALRIVRPPFDDFHPYVERYLDAL